MESKFEVEIALQNLEALIDMLHTAADGNDALTPETIGAYTNVMSDVIMNLRRALKTE